MLKDRSLWYNSPDDSEMTEPSKDNFDGYMQGYRLGWKDSGAYVDKMWISGKRYFNSDVTFTS